MHVTSKLAALAVGTALVVGGSAAFASRAPVVRVVRAAAGTSAATGPSENRFVPLSAPCRIIDTRLAKAGSLALGAPRGFKIIGTGAVFKDQGGTDGGCGVPQDATAVTVAVTATQATGKGYLRTAPSAVPATTTYLNFVPRIDFTSAGTLAICASCTGSDNLFMTIFGSAGLATHVIADVSGYMIPPTAAHVLADGTLDPARSSRVVSVIHPAGTLAYRVRFDHDVSHCNATAISEAFGEPVSAIVPGPDASTLDFAVGQPTLKAEAGFNLAVDC